MIHLALILVCILSVEIFIRLNFLLHIDSILKVTKKVTYIILQKKISDHWKEKVIPIYALKIMTSSLQIFFILLFITSLFLIANVFFISFLAHTFSLNGITESIIFAFGYFYSRKLFIK